MNGGRGGESEGIKSVVDTQGGGETGSLRPVGFVESTPQVRSSVRNRSKSDTGV